MAWFRGWELISGLISGSCLTCQHRSHFYLIILQAKMHGSKIVKGSKSIMVGIWKMLGSEEKNGDIRKRRLCRLQCFQHLTDGRH